MTGIMEEKEIAILKDKNENLKKIGEIDKLIIDMTYKILRLKYTIENHDSKKELEKLNCELKSCNDFEEKMKILDLEEQKKFLSVRIENVHSKFQLEIKIEKCNEGVKDLTIELKKLESEIIIKNTERKKELENFTNILEKIQEITKVKENLEKL